MREKSGVKRTSEKLRQSGTWKESVDVLNDVGQITLLFLRLYRSGGHINLAFAIVIVRILPLANTDTKVTKRLGCRRVVEIRERSESAYICMRVPCLKGDQYVRVNECTATSALYYRRVYFSRNACTLVCTFTLSTTYMHTGPLDGYSTHNDKGIFGPTELWIELHRV